MFTRGDLWALYTLVSGFPDESSRIEFERIIHSAIFGKSLWPWQVREVMESQVLVLNEQQQFNHSLKIMLLGNLDEDLVRQHCRDEPFVHVSSEFRSVF